MGGIDRLLFRSVNGWPNALSPFLSAFSNAPGSPYFKPALALIVLVMIALGPAQRRAALLSLVAFPISDGLCNLAKHLVPMHRPFQVLANVVMRSGASGSMGTASSHAANMAAVATVMTLGLGLRWGAAWIVVAILTGVSRVYVGVHYPSQVLLGWAVGIAVAFAVDALARAYVRRRRASSDSPQP